MLSGVIVKAGVIGLIRFLPEGAALPDWSALLAAIGLLTAWWGVACGITQLNPKTVLAHSTVSQMGVVAAVLGMGLAADGAGMPAAFYAAHHVLAKGALFLVVGVVAATGGRRLWPVLLGAALALLRRFGDRLPQLPEGDIVVLVERAARAGPALAAPLARAENVLQRWPVAGVALLALVIILGAAIVDHAP